jgi:putative ABC transport system permease protein
VGTVALRMLFGDPGKYLGLVFGIAFATLLMAQQAGLFAGIIGRTVSQIVDVREADLWVMDSRVRYSDVNEPMTDTQLYRVRSVAGVAWALPFLRNMGTVRSPDGILEQILLLGVDDATLAGVPPKFILGDLDALRAPDAMAIDKSGFMRLWPGVPLDLGREVEINDRRVRVAAIVDASAPFATSPVIFVKYSLALNLAAQRRSQLSYVIARAADGHDPAEVAARIQAETGLQATTTSGFARMTVLYFLRNTGIPINFGITIALGFIVGAAIVGQTFFLFVVENLKQFGALKAIGVGNAAILRMVLLQAGVAAITGYSLGIGMAAAFFHFVPQVSDALRGLVLPWEVASGVAVAVLAIIAVASLASVRRVLVVDPAIVFRG